MEQFTPLECPVFGCNRCPTQTQGLLLHLRTMHGLNTDTLKLEVPKGIKYHPLISQRMKVPIEVLQARYPVDYANTLNSYKSLVKNYVPKVIDMKEVPQAIFVAG